MLDKIFWDLLKGIETINITACSKTHNSKLFSIGQGKVEVNIITPATIKVTEFGKWSYLYEKNAEIKFKNIYLWTYIEKKSLITLEHLRYGENKPFFLFNLICVKDELLRSSSPMHCGVDNYTAEIKLKMSSFTLKSFVNGPNKNEEILYFYS